MDKHFELENFRLLYCCSAPVSSQIKLVNTPSQKEIVIHVYYVPIYMNLFNLFEIAF